ncbi:hypothetical protein [Brachybacterium massiliense]|uniref:hypothetical protein n=1 Tax=Brachybacterium massiliense TaxID=1755098 RepID=UPI000B3BAEA7|nr:hypothetical protein [Brachybacterium massiliense]
MITEQTRRRRRGRAIRKARRAQQHHRTAQSPFDRFHRWSSEGITATVARTLDALAGALVAIGTTARVAASRITPLLLTPRDGAGARRQLLHNGRAPRKGGR